MKLAALSIALALAAAAAHAQGGSQPAAHEPAACCETSAKAKAYQATGVIKKTDAAKSSVTVAHGPVKDLNWPAMTMAFKVIDKALLDKLAVDRKVEFSFAQDGKIFVVDPTRTPTGFGHERSK